MTDEEACAFADEWIAAWNARDLDRVLSHYAEDVVFLSPLAQKVVGNGRVAGRAALRAYWSAALTRQPNLKFEFVDLRVGHESLTILYRNHRNQDAAETFELGADGTIVRAFACYAG